MACDRFIPNRSKLNFDLAYHCIESGKNPIEKNILTQKPNSWTQQNFQKLIKNTIFGNCDRVLIFTGPSRKKQRSQKKKMTYDESKNWRDWPVIPRKRPITKGPELVLDMDGISKNMYVNLVDWGSNDQLAGAIQSRVYLWNYLTNKCSIAMDAGSTIVTGVAWNSRGTHLAIINNSGCIFNLNTRDQIAEIKSLKTPCCNQRLVCCCTAVAWDNLDKRIIVGCSNGQMTIICAQKFCVLAFLTIHLGQVLALKFSPDGRYLATIDDVDNFVRLWKWPKVEPHFEINYDSPVRALAWHPWRSSFLAVGGGNNDGSIALWKVAITKSVGYHEPATPAKINCLEFSKITGELIVSYELQSTDGTVNESNVEEPINKLLVLDALGHSIESIKIRGSVMYILWNADGHKLLTISSNETMLMWNYLGEPKKTRGTKRRSLQSLSRENEDHLMSPDFTLNRFGTIR